MAKLFSHIQFHSLVISYQALGIWEKYIAKVSELPSLLQIRRAWYHTRSASLEPTRYLVYFMCSFEHRPRLIPMIPILIKLMSCYELWIISDTFPIFFYYSVHFFFFLNFLLLLLLLLTRQKYRISFGFANETCQYTQQTAAARQR